MSDISDRLHKLAGEIRTATFWKDTIKEDQTPEEALLKFRSKLADTYFHHLNMIMSGVKVTRGARIHDSSRHGTGHKAYLHIQHKMDEGTDDEKHVWYSLSGAMDAGKLTWSWSVVEEGYDDVRDRYTEKKLDDGNLSLKFDDTSAKDAWGAVWDKVKGWDCWA